MNKITNTRQFHKNAKKTITNIIKSFEDLPTLDMSNLSPENTAVVVVDMLVGFAKKGDMYSDRVEALIPYTVKTLQLFKGFTKLFLCDKHTDKSTEFKKFRPHSKENDDEAEIVDELKPFVQDKGIICYKNSTNGFFSPQYADWLIKNPKITNLIIIGDLTDLCVSQYVITQLCFWDEWNIEGQIVLPLPGIDTYQYEAKDAYHNADLMNVFALYNMQLNGAILVSDIHN